MEFVVVGTEKKFEFRNNKSYIEFEFRLSVSTSSLISRMNLNI
jgi:hypothetical protein